ncbi:hypothetical protein GCM10011506_34100 [Marivirga lumbricoides]|uniref:Uncharacterized protein n=1 Tax=Marivirga lumbricoides TaxID=1046115 RepID=A0ABQ1MTB0_9BACT|nr:hypothetical protein GCM10011506_34100 [Marivirga lumbricoides]
MKTDYTIEIVKEQVADQLNPCDAMRVLKYIQSKTFRDFFAMIQSDNNVPLIDKKMVVGSHINTLLYYFRAEEETEKKGDVRRELARINVNHN